MADVNEELVMVNLVVMTANAVISKSWWYFANVSVIVVINGAFVIIVITFFIINEDDVHVVTVTVTAVA